MNNREVKMTTFKAILNGERGPEVRADLVVTLQGLGIFALALVMIPLHVPQVAAIGLELLLSTVCAYRWFLSRARAQVLATV
jgi:hypothetical protein